MGAYAYTATMTTRVAKKMLGYPGVGMVFGLINVTNYNQTRVEVSEISKVFATLGAVIPTGISSGGYGVIWDVASKSFKCFYLAPAITPAGTLSGGTLAAGAVTVVGGQGAAAALQINPDSNAGVLGKTAATTRTIPSATFGIADPTIAVQPTFTGNAVAAAAAAEVANDVNVGSFHVVAFGIVKF